MPIVISGFSDTDKVPSFVGETVFGAGAITAASIPLTLLLVGLTASGATMTADTDVKDVVSQDQADTYAGAGSELARMVRAAIKVPGVRLKIAAPTGGGGAQATATITVGGSWSTGGTLRFWVGGDLVTVTITAAHTTTTAATAIRDAFLAKGYLACTAGSSGAVVTLTIKSAGIRGNKYILFKDLTDGPSGLTAALAGGSSVTGGGVLFTGGTGTETLTTLLSTLFPGRYHRIAFAQSDATSAAAWETQLDTKAGPLEGRMEHGVLADNVALATITSVAQTTLNNARFQCAWLLNSESHPSEIAAAIAAERTSREQTNPNQNLDFVVLKGIAPQRATADWASRSTQQSALDNSVTPLMTSEDGTSVFIVRAITTKSRLGSDPDYRTLDVAQAVVPDYVRDRLRLKWTTSVLPNNPYVTDDPADGEPDAPEGVMTPSRWNAVVKAELYTMQEEKILTQVAENLPASEWNATATRIMSAVPVIPLPLQHQIGVSVRQLNAA